MWRSVLGLIIIDRIIEREVRAERQGQGAEGVVFGEGCPPPQWRRGV